MIDAEVLPRKIAIIGGTGKEGKGLAYRWAKAGIEIIIGSRSEEKALQAVNELTTMLPSGCKVTGMVNPLAAAEGEVVVLTVPFAAHRDTLNSISEGLQGKILVDVSVPLVPPKVTRVQMPPEGSAAQQAQAILGEGVAVIAAFQNISYEHLLNDVEIECDVLVCGNGKNARQVVLKLVEAAGLKGWDAGPIENAMVVEGMTSILIGINKNHGVDSAGIKITGVD